MDVMEVFTELMTNASKTKKLGAKVGASNDQIMQLTKLGFPALLAALDKNANSKEGAASLYQALEQHQDDPVEDPDNFLENVDTEDGEKMLSHIFLNKKEAVEKTLSKQTGLNMSQVASLLQRFGPLLLALLAKKKKESNVNLDGLSGLTSALTNTYSQSNEGGGIMGVMTQLLDSDKDGSIIDDIGTLFGKFFSK